LELWFHEEPTAGCCVHDTEPKISMKNAIFGLFLVYTSMTRPCNANIQDAAHTESMFNLSLIQCKWIKIETPSGAQNSAHTYSILYAALHAAFASLTTAAKRTRTFSKIADVHMSVVVPYYSVDILHDTRATRLLLVT